MKANGSSDKASDHLNTGFVILPTALLADVATKKISEAAFTLYAFVKFWEGQNDDLWYGIRKMAEKTGFSQSKVKRLMNEELLPNGHIGRQKRMNKSSRTKCLTYVDKGTVFVAGKPVNPKTKSQTPDQTRGTAKEAAQEEAKPNTKAPTGQVEQDEAEMSPAFSESVVEPARDNEFPNDEKPADDSWMRKFGWDSRRRFRFHELSQAYDKIEAKRVFLEELSWDDPEAEQAYKEEFPDKEGITLFGKSQSDGANGSERTDNSLDQSGKPNYGAEDDEDEPLF